MFETALTSLRPRRRGSIAASTGIHLLLGGGLVVQPMLRMPELTAEPPDRMPPVVLPARIVETLDEPVRTAARPPRGENGGNRTPRLASPGRRYVAPPPAGVIPDLANVAANQAGEEGGEITFEPPSGPGEGPGTPGDDTGGDAPIVMGPDVDPPLPLFTPVPDYPDLMRIAGKEGIVILEAVIGPDGLVRDLRVLRGVNAVLDRAAMEGVKTWRYRPARVAGRAIAVYLTVTVNFRIQR